MTIVLGLLLGTRLAKRAPIPATCTLAMTPTSLGRAVPSCGVAPEVLE